MKPKCKKPKMTAAAPPAPPTLRRLRPVCPTLLSYDGRARDVAPWTWLGGGGALPAAAQVRYDVFGSPCQQLVDGATGRRRVTQTLVVNVKGLGSVVIAGDGTGEKPTRLTCATCTPDPLLVADAFAGTYGEPLSDGFFDPTTSGPRLVRWVELACLGIAALYCRTDEPPHGGLCQLAELFADSWRWDDEYPVGPIGSRIDLTDPRTWFLS